MRKMAFVLLLLVLTGCAPKKEEPQFVNTATHQEFLENGIITGTNDYYAPVDDRGLVIGVEEYSNGVLTFRSSFAYDSFGNVIQVTEEKDGTSKTSEYKNTLDEKGRILRQEIWSEGTMLSFEEHSYDRKGNETHHHSSLWNQIEQETDWRTHTMEYDRKGNLIRKELHWNFNDEYIVWEYENGQCIRQTSFQEETGLVTEKQENTYDKNGNQTGTTYHNPVTDKVTERWEYAYDEQGRCIRETRYGKTGEPEMYREYAYDDEARTMTSTPYNTKGMLHESHDVYHYDEYGNEILRERYEDGEVYWRISFTWERLETAQ